MTFLAEVWSIVTDAAYWSGGGSIPVRTVQHMQLSLLAVAVATAIALPMGVAIGHLRRAEFVVVNTANIGRALPTFAIIALFWPFSIRWGWGIGFWPTALALFVLAIPPILTNAYVGVKQADADSLEAARGMGMSERQVLTSVELPLAAPLVLAGVRIALVQVVATATFAAVFGGGGLGRFIIDGFAVRNMPLVFVGALAVAVLAVVVEIVMGVVERVATPRAVSRPRDVAPELRAAVSDT